MQKKIATVAGAGNCLRGSRVAGDHNAAVGGIKAVSISKIPGAVSDGEGSHFDVGILIDKARLDFMRVDLIGSSVSVFQTFSANGHVLYVSCLYVGGHIGDAGRAVELQRSRPAFHSGREI